MMDFVFKVGLEHGLGAPEFNYLSCRYKYTQV